MPTSGSSSSRASAAAAGACGTSGPGSWPMQDGRAASDSARHPSGRSGRSGSQPARGRTWPPRMTMSRRLVVPSTNSGSWSRRARAGKSRAKTESSSGSPSAASSAGPAARSALLAAAARSSPSRL
eukprot:scaffold934_cov271-Prasinococcus_capsulatus_cf.AAC.1